MIYRPRLLPGAYAPAIALAVLVLLTPVRADDQTRLPRWPTATEPAYPSSPYHGVTDGNGNVIPCRCRFQGHEFRVGEEVCMSTHVGVVIARCDLMQNNTSWVPTETACTISSAPPAAGGSTQMAGAEPQASVPSPPSKRFTRRAE
jgi:hypothetical protein